MISLKVLLRSNFRIPFICGWLVVYVLKYMLSKLYPHKMKESAIFLRSNSTNFHPPLNRHVPGAWLPKADGVQWQQRKNRGRVTREKQVTSDSQLEAQASLTRLNSHTVSNTFSKNVSFFQWWEVAVLFSGITTALIERQELRCMRVRPTDWEMCGSSLLSCTFCYFLGLVRGTLGHSTQVSEHKLKLIFWKG